MKQKYCRHNLQLGQHPIDGADGTTVKRLKQKTVETENIRKSMTDEAVETVEHYIEDPRKPVLQEKQVFLVNSNVRALINDALLNYN